MSLTLEVELSGLCFYIEHPDGKNVAMVMPDARKASDGRPIIAADGEIMALHAGYVRYDLADTGAVPKTLHGRDGTPAFEAVRRFDFDDLLFRPGGADSDEPPGDEGGSTSEEPADTPAQREYRFLNPELEAGICMPDVNDYAPTFTPVPGLFDPAPPPQLLMRTVFEGGEFSSSRNDGSWTFEPTLLSNGAAPAPTQFAGFVRWSRPYKNASWLELVFRDFAGVEKAAIKLYPSKPNGTIRLKIANLCADNPLEWPEMFLRPFRGLFDDDFRWFYRLLKDNDGRLSRVGPGPYKRKLPVPKLVSARGGGPDDCTGTKTSFDFLTLGRAASNRLTPGDGASNAE